VPGDLYQEEAAMPMTGRERPPSRGNAGSGRRTRTSSCGGAPASLPAPPNRPIVRTDHRKDRTTTYSSAIQQRCGSVSARVSTPRERSPGKAASLPFERALGGSGDRKLLPPLR
jgi:hypothetical protein